jgi:flagellar biosynthesis/type III secretory pathway chaperone
VNTQNPLQSPHPLQADAEGFFNEKLDELSSILCQETRLYQELIGLLQREKEAMIDLSLEDLHACNNQKQTLLLKLKVLENSRTAVLEKLSGWLGLPVSELTLSYLSDFATEPRRTALLRCRDQMGTVVESLQEVSQVNQILVERSLESIQDFFTVLQLLGGPVQVYLPSGRIALGERQGTILSREG